jgi:hypothetical protein
MPHDLGEARGMNEEPLFVALDKPTAKTPATESRNTFGLHGLVESQDARLSNHAYKLLRPLFAQSSAAFRRCWPILGVVGVYIFPRPHLAPEWASEF